MQSTTPMQGMGMDQGSSNLSFQFPLFYNPKLFPNCFGLTFTPSMGVGFLSNAPLSAPLS